MNTLRGGTLSHTPMPAGASPYLGPSASPGSRVPDSKVPDRAASGAESPTVDGRSVRWESHREERRRQLIRETRRAIHQLGPDASMEDIAAVAGTSKSVFYRYFGDKSGLRTAVGSVVIRTMQQRIADAREAATEPRDGVTAMVAAYLQMAQTSPNVYFFATLPSEGDKRQLGELSGFFDAVTAMITKPLKHLLGDSNSPLVGYWPAAAIGLVRTAGELWLQTPEDAAKPDAATMAKQISAWLFDGVANAVSPTQTSRTDSGPHSAGEGTL